MLTTHKQKTNTLAHRFIFFDTQEQKMFLERDQVDKTII